MSRWLCACGLLWATIAQSEAQQFMGYSPRWYGPNANPIPEAREAIIPSGLRLHNSLKYQLSNKDKTATLFTDLEIPIVSERASVRIYAMGRSTSTGRRRALAEEAWEAPRRRGSS